MSYICIAIALGTLEDFQITSQAIAFILNLKLKSNKLALNDRIQTAVVAWRSSLVN
jgi:hypothetical protein